MSRFSLMSELKDFVVALAFFVCVICCIVSVLNTSNVMIGPQGIQGEKGEQGIPGERGEQGEKGDTGEQGPQGIQGEHGIDGIDGQTPFIGENGTWWVGDSDTGVLASTTIYVPQEVFTDWANCKVGDYVAFNFSPLYVSARSDYYIYGYQYDKSGDLCCIHTTSYQIGQYSFKKPSSDEDRYIYDHDTYYVCLGRIVEVDHNHVKVDILHAKIEEL